MQNVSDKVKSESIESLQSTIRKTEKAFVQMSQKATNTTLIEKRLSALQVSLGVLDNVWNQSSHTYSKGDLIKARSILLGLLPSIKKIYSNLKFGSSQRTLLERRIKALELAIESIDDLNMALLEL